MTRPPDRQDDDDRAAFWEAMGNAFRPYAGWAFYGFGVVLVLLGYFGISGESVVAKQLPYLISGGIGGILLALLGAYFLGIEELRRDSGRLDRMEKQVAELHRALLDRADAPVVEDVTTVATSHDAVGSNGRGADQEVFVVEAGESFHRRGCALTDGKVARGMTREAVTAQGLRPCPVCEPVVPVS